jgi:hypothetical protein
MADRRAISNFDAVLGTSRGAVNASRDEEEAWMAFLLGQESRTQTSRSDAITDECVVLSCDGEILAWSVGTEVAREVFPRLPLAPARGAAMRKAAAVAAKGFPVQFQGDIFHGSSDAALAHLAQTGAYRAGLVRTGHMTKRDAIAAVARELERAQGLDEKFALIEVSTGRVPPFVHDELRELQRKGLIAEEGWSRSGRYNLTADGALVVVELDKD